MATPISKSATYYQIAKRRLEPGCRRMFYVEGENLAHSAPPANMCATPGELVPPDSPGTEFLPREICEQCEGTP